MNPRTLKMEEGTGASETPTQGRNPARDSPPARPRISASPLPPPSLEFEFEFY